MVTTAVLLPEFNKKRTKKRNPDLHKIQLLIMDSALLITGRTKLLKAVLSVLAPERQLISQSTLRNRLQNELKDSTCPVTKANLHPTQIKSLVPAVP